MTENTQAKIFAILFVLLIVMAVLGFWYRVLKKGGGVMLSKMRKQDVSSYRMQNIFTIF